MTPLCGWQSFWKKTGIVTGRFEYSTLHRLNLQSATGPLAS